MATSPYELAHTHVVALLKAAEAADLAADVVARALLAEVIGIFKQHRSLEDIASELTFAADNLDDDETYPFMRP